jgi:hypothetical protein
MCSVVMVGFRCEVSTTHLVVRSLLAETAIFLLQRRACRLGAAATARNLEQRAVGSLWWHESAMATTASLVKQVRPLLLTHVLRVS